MTQASPATWRSDGGAADFYAAKGVVEALIAVVGLKLGVEPAAQPFLHPGRSARVLVNAAEVGWIGELHPLVAREWDLEGAAVFELDADLLAELTEGVVSAYEDVTSFPAVLQDIAVVVTTDVSAATVEAAVRKGGGELLTAVGVFDVYEGEQVGEGKRSLALRLEFRAPDRTLTEDEVVERRAAIESALGEIGGRIRG